MRSAKIGLRNAQVAGENSPIEPSEGESWQTTEFEILQCKWTDNHLYLNASDTRILIIPGWNRKNLVLCAGEALAGVVKKFYQTPNTWHIADRQTIVRLLENIISDPCIHSLGALLDELSKYNKKTPVHELTVQRFPAVRNLSIKIVYHFYYHGIIALFPNSCYSLNKIHLIPTPWICSGCGVEVISLVVKHVSSSWDSFVPKILSSLGNIKSVMDLDGLIIKRFIPVDQIYGRMVYGPLSLGIVRAFHEVNPGFNIQHYEYYEKMPPSKDVFSGLSLDSSLADWVNLGREYYKQAEAKSDKRRAVRSFINHLVANPKISKVPREYFDKSSKIEPIFESDTQALDRFVFKFIQWVFEKECCVIDDNGHWVCIDSQRYANPMERPAISYSQDNGKTFRSVMPTKILEACKEILLADDFAWSKGHQSHWFISAIGNTIFSPVLTVATLIKLSIPARNKQIITLGSGEGDSLRCEATEPYDLRKGPEAVFFLPNKGPLAPGPSKRLIQEGVFRRVPRFSGEFACCLFFNNNKTADRNKDLDSYGYVMPWENLEAIGYALYLRDWQEKYNPTTMRVCWGDVEWLRKDKDLKILTKKKDYFLFRDPSNFKNPNKSHPIFNQKLLQFWNYLIEEVQRRLNIVDGTPENPMPYQFVLSRDDRGRPSKCKWDLHSMRVTILSYLHDNGVPLEYLRELAGHKSIQMASRYSVIDPEKMVSLIAEASAKWKGMAAEEWGTYLRGVEREKVKDLLVAKDDAVLEQIFLSDRDGLVVMDHGVCLMGQRMCHQGLEVLDEDGNRSYVTVPGGKANCVRCRYFATGPAWLPGLAAHFNWLTLRLTKESRILDPLKEVYEDQMTEFRRCVRECSPFSGRAKLERASSAHDTAFARTNELGHSWQATYRLWEQARELARLEADKPTQGLSLIVQGNLETMQFVLEKCHSTDLLASILETGNLYQAVSQPHEANQDLCCSLDRMLFNNGVPGLLVTLGEEEKRVAALEIYKWLRHRTQTDEDYANVVDCRTTLQSLGFQWEFLEKLRTMEPFKLNLPEEATIQRKVKPRVNERKQKTLSMRSNHG